MMFVTLDDGKRHLHLHPTNIDHDVDVFIKIEQASMIVYDYLKLSEIPSAWKVADSSPMILTVPANVQAATLLVLGELFMNRESINADVLSPTVLSLLHRLRDPAMA